MPPEDDDRNELLLTVRTSVVLLLAILRGIAGAVLTRLADHSDFEATLIGLGTTAAGITASLCPSRLGDAN